jgi:DNA-binding response OmpR family regulator
MSDTANILLVDDEPGMLRYIRTLLEVDDYKVETASTGEEALQRVEKGLNPDMVLLDVLMPGIDGLATLEQLRQMKPGVKVVMLSCVNDTRKVVQAMRLGAQDYLTKPFQKAELDAVIDQCLGKSRNSATMCSSWPPVRPCAKSARKPRWWLTWTSRYSCSAKAERARRSWRDSCTSSRRARTAPS